MRKLTLLLALLAVSVLSLSAQRYGHLNFGNLLSIMPESKAANDTLAALQKTMVAKGEAMAASFEKDYVAFVKAVQAGDLPPRDQQNQEASLRKRQEEIVAYEEEIMATIEAKRNELLKPIIDKAQETIETVARENGYVMVFDTSIFNAIMYAEETEDLMPKVKEKLGIQ
ncbi:MAG: OmpH family outer membrane protein [Saprospiraceae bacterium]